ncbi:hypothetical protein OAC51_02925, partial [Flavobacteriaceae bacterium]|nr:hypothetical protein [Flavobacteriaceae bacterium]
MEERMRRLESNLTRLGLERPKQVEIKNHEEFKEFNISKEKNSDIRNAYHSAMSELETTIGQVAYDRALEKNSKTFEIISETALGVLNLLKAYAQLGAEINLPILFDSANDSKIINEIQNSKHFHLEISQILELQEIVLNPSFRKLQETLNEWQPSENKNHEIWNVLFKISKETAFELKIEDDDTTENEVISIVDKRGKKIFELFNKAFEGKEEEKKGIKKICEQISTGGFPRALNHTMFRSIDLLDGHEMYDVINNPIDPKDNTNLPLEKESKTYKRPTFINTVMGGENKTSDLMVDEKLRLFNILMAHFQDFSNQEITPSNVWKKTEKTIDGNTIRVNRIISTGRPDSPLSIINHIDPKYQKLNKIPKASQFRAQMEFLGHSNLILAQIYKLEPKNFKRLQEIFKKEFGGILNNDTSEKLIFNTLLDGGPLALPARNNLRIPRTPDEKNEALNLQGEIDINKKGEFSDAEKRIIKGSSSHNHPEFALRVAQGRDFNTMIDTKVKLAKLKPYAPEVIKKYVEQIEQFGLISAAGVSATTARNLVIAEALGILKGNEDLFNFIEATIAYFVKAKHHSVIEILYGAANVGTNSIHQLEVLPFLHYMVNPTDLRFQDEVNDRFSSNHKSAYETMIELAPLPKSTLSELYEFSVRKSQKTKSSVLPGDVDQVPKDNIKHKIAE